MAERAIRKERNVWMGSDTESAKQMLLRARNTQATTSALPKTGDNYWIAASLTLFLLGTVLLSAAYRC